MGLAASSLRDASIRAGQPFEPPQSDWGVKQEDVVESSNHHWLRQVYQGRIKIGDGRVVSSARYLGATIGPKAHEECWKEVAAKLIKRARWIRGQDGVCVSRAVAAYQTYALGHAAIPRVIYSEQRGRA